MKRAHFSEEPIIGILKAAEAVGNIREVGREHSITVPTFYRWRRKYGGMGVMLDPYWEPRDGPTLRSICGLGFLCDLFECRPLVFESLAVTVCPKLAGMPNFTFSSTRKSLFNSRGIP